MMHPEFYNIAPDAICIKDCADQFYELPHSVTEPSLYMAPDRGVKVLQTLLTGCVHAKLSLVRWADSRIRPSCSPDVKARQLDEGQHLNTNTRPGRNVSSAGRPRRPSHSWHVLLP